MALGELPAISASPVPDPVARYVIHTGDVAFAENESIVRHMKSETAEEPEPRRIRGARDDTVERSSATSERRAAIADDAKSSRVADTVCALLPAAEVVPSASSV
eukprot:354788-Chlamydomonas_euryale.AAC.1